MQGFTSQNVYCKNRFNIWFVLQIFFHCNPPNIFRLIRKISIYPIDTDDPFVFFWQPNSFKRVIIIFMEFDIVDKIPFTLVSVVIFRFRITTSFLSVSKCRSKSFFCFCSKLFFNQWLKVTTTSNAVLILFRDTTFWRIAFDCSTKGTDNFYFLHTIASFFFCNCIRYHSFCQNYE